MPPTIRNIKKCKLSVTKVNSIPSMIGAPSMDSSVNNVPNHVPHRCGKCHKYKNPTGRTNNKLSVSQRQRAHSCSPADACTNWANCPIELDKRAKYHKTPEERTAIQAARKQIKNETKRKEKEEKEKEEEQYHIQRRGKLKLCTFFTYFKNLLHKSPLNAQKWIPMPFKTQ